MRFKRTGFLDFLESCDERRIGGLPMKDESLDSDSNVRKKKKLRRGVSRARGASRE